ncbi:MAG: TerC family protein [Microbacteriaceae bacterium]|nr:TerC family protein [Microbacteriaceae bacterium]
MTGSIIVLVAILCIDLLLIIKRPHIPTMRESAIWVGIYVALALVFAGLMFAIGDAKHGSEFLAGWLTEYSLSVDNLFVFVLIIGAFKVPEKYVQRALMIGIVLALIFRGIFILAGAALISQFSWVFYIFGAWLVYTAIKQAMSGEEDVEKEGVMVRLVRRWFPYVDKFHGGKLTVVENGKRHITPMLLVLFALGSTDLLFALDSIPAIFGITPDPFIVFTANIFALMGLRQLYFLLGGLLDKLEYLHYGIAAILGFIGVKLVLHAISHNELPFINNGEHINVWTPDTWTSLGFIVVSMVVATTASVIKMRRDARAEKQNQTGR